MILVNIYLALSLEGLGWTSKQNLQQEWIFFSFLPSPSFFFFFSYLNMRSHVTQAGHQLTKLLMMTLNFYLESFCLHLPGAGITNVHLFLKCWGSNPGHARLNSTS